MSSKWNVESVIKKIRQQNKKAHIIIKKNGETVDVVWEDESPSELIISQSVSSYYPLHFFRKSIWEINLQ